MECLLVRHASIDPCGSSVGKKTSFSNCGNTTAQTFSIPCIDKLASAMEMVYLLPELGRILETGHGEGCLIEHSNSSSLRKFK